MIGGKPTAVAYFRDSDGVTRKMQRQGRTPTDAENRLKEAMKDRLAPAAGDLDRHSTVRDVANLWRVELEDSTRAPGTKRQYRDRLDKQILPGLGDVRLEELNVPRVDRFLKVVRKQHGDSTAKLTRVVLSSLLGLAVRHVPRLTNPVTDTEPVPRKKKAVLAPGPQDVLAVVNRFREWDAGKDKRGAERTTDIADPALLILITGVRTGEALGLRWVDVDLESSPARISIRGIAAYDEIGRLHWQPHPKSDGSKRTLLVPAFAADMLLRRRVASRVEWVFPSSTGTLRSPNNYRTMWRAALMDSDYLGLTPRDMRKSVATLLDKELGTEAAQRQLGHESDEITKAHYIERSHMGPDATSVLQRVFGQNSE